MYLIPVHEFRRRLRKWEAAEDRYIVRTENERGRPVKEYWSLGVCRLRVVYHRDGAELYGDRGCPRWRIEQRQQVGKIAFKYFGDAGT